MMGKHLKAIGALVASIFLVSIPMLFIALVFLWRSGDFSSGGIPFLAVISGIVSLGEVAGIAIVIYYDCED
jgi:hypothetical protein